MANIAIEKIYLGVLTIIFRLVLSLYRPGDVRGGVVKSPTLFTRTNFFVPIFRNFVFEVSADRFTIGLLIFCTQTLVLFLSGHFLAEDDLTRINFRVPIFLKRLFLQWFVVVAEAVGVLRLAPMFSFSLEDLNLILPTICYGSWNILLIAIKTVLEQPSFSGHFP